MTHAKIIGLIVLSLAMVGCQKEAPTAAIDSPPPADSSEALISDAVISPPVNSVVEPTGPVTDGAASIALNETRTKLENPAVVSIDGLNGITLPKPGSVIAVTGESFWIAGFAVDNVNMSPAAGVIIVVDGQTYIADYGGERADIATSLNNPNFLKSQFYASIPTDTLENGLHDISLRVIAADRSGYFASEWSAKISITKNN